MNSKKLRPNFSKVSLIFFVLSALYPVVMYWSLSAGHLQISSIVLLFLALLLFIRKYHQTKTLSSSVGQPVCLVVLASLFYFHKDPRYVQFYPILVNAVLFVVFGASLWSKETVIEKIARLSGEEILPHVKVYTRRVTLVWMVFFIFNISVVAYLIYINNFEWWALYSGLISYVLMGILFALEFLFRSYLKSKRAGRNVS